MRHLIVIISALLILSGCSSFISGSPKEYEAALKKINKSDWDGALNDLNRSIEKAPEYAEAYFQIASIYYKQKKYDDAIRAVDVYLKELNQINELKSKTDLKFWNAYQLKGLCYFQENNFDKVIDEFSTAANYNPKDYISPYYIAIAKIKLNDLKSAEYFFDRSMAVCDNCGCKNCYQNYYNIGLIKLSDLKDSSGALKAFNKAIEKKSDYHEAVISKSILSLSLKNPDSTISEMEEYLNRLNKKNKKPYEWMSLNWGIELAKHGYCKNAMKYLKYSLENKTFTHCFNENDMNSYINFCGVIIHRDSIKKSNH